MTIEETGCAIAGGGPAGLMLGLLLARAGVRVTVLEKHGDFLRDFRGDTVHPSTLRLLDELGLGERFARLPVRRLERMRARIGAETVTLADFTRIPGPHRYLAMVPQWEFLDLLATAAAAEPEFTLRRNSTVSGLRRADSGRVTGVRYRDVSGDHTLAAALTVACDGRGSVLRRAAGLPATRFDVPMDVWQVRIPKTENGSESQVFAWFGAGQVAVTMDRGDYFQTAYLIPKGSDAARRRADVAVLREHLGAMFGWPPECTAAIRSWHDVPLLRTEMDLLDRWYTDGLLCIGDAAHTMSPVGGVGVNLAIQDAVAAARILAAPLRGGRVGTRALARVQRRRALPTRVVQRSQRSEHDMLLRPALAGVLDGVPPPLRAVRRVPFLQGVTAYLGGIGIRSERAPAFARRDA
ncbi:FAD-dependent oxidoreductase [Nocardia harenae]|uniref:FAD-dependent oxidoreductase n=1 Tax=Nocardia harenae TaxID=358707 RepID=UPI000A03C867|nr:FAD-dependent oxidoreductase [Nocardia harenae]